MYKRVLCSQNVFINMIGIIKKIRRNYGKNSFGFGVKTNG